jgi:hypothetical protein
MEKWWQEPGEIEFLDIQAMIACGLQERLIQAGKEEEATGTGRPIEEAKEEATGTGRLIEEAD